MRSKRRILHNPVVVSVHLPEDYIEKMDALVKMGLFKSRSEIVEIALQELVSKYNVTIEDEDIDVLRGR
ncbi:ribbon-helix-helix domain-containing protein [Thermoproteus tenax]|uniref:CopG/MetJ family transcriptional regulator n=1 Tax=Thermoproteus tenax (strain ATCC 35583 / DSM 2078 / JCM 9277 / NBRC 100435 / Kra 1) TaxID=768679 RepID=G4RJE8_THETK|nr:ribbon-helix-helix domain-containing protein [Thermoproteus tenax]CCC81693.1 CopG/MetJ family transcriptional regulator [Thermoproteus tenax Kra 1]